MRPRTPLGGWASATWCSWWTGTTSASTPAPPRASCTAPRSTGLRPTGGRSPAPIRGPTGGRSPGLCWRPPAATTPSGCLASPTSRLAKGAGTASTTTGVTALPGPSTRQSSGPRERSSWRAIRWNMSASVGWRPRIPRSCRPRRRRTCGWRSVSCVATTPSWTGSRTAS